VTALTNNSYMHRAQAPLRRVCTPRRSLATHSRYRHRQDRASPASTGRYPRGSTRAGTTSLSCQLAKAAKTAQFIRVRKQAFIAICNKVLLANTSNLSCRRHRIDSSSPQGVASLQVTKSWSIRSRDNLQVEASQISSASLQIQAHINKMVAQG